MTKLNRTAPVMGAPLLTLAPNAPNLADGDEPTAAELDAINDELPLIAAEVAVVDAEIAIISAPHGPTDLDWQRLRRARRVVLREAAALASHTAPPMVRAA
jgi:hypothetical protein